MSKEKTEKLHSAKKILLTVLIIVLAIILLFFAAVRIYFRAPVKQYYSDSEKTFVIPGLSDGFVAQGLSYDSRTDSFFVTGYMKDGGASPVYIVNKTDEKLTKTLYLQNDDGTDYIGHAGGITVHGNYVYIAGGEDCCLYVYDYSEMISSDTGSRIKSLGEFSTGLSDSDYISVAFTADAGDRLIVGEFYREPNYPTPDSHKLIVGGNITNSALAAAFLYDDTAKFGLSDQISEAYSLPDQIQGMSVNENRIYLSSSYGPAFSRLYAYDAGKTETSEITLLGQTVPLYILNDGSLIKTVKAPPMSEEIAEVDGKLYTMCESASNKYIFGKFTSAKYCYATELSAFEED